MEHEHRKLGEILREAGAITEEQLREALVLQKKSGQFLGATLIRMGVLTEEVLLQTLQQQLGLPLVDLEEVSVDPLALALVKEEIARKHSAIPLEILGRSTLVVAVADPLNMAALEDLRFHSGMFVKPVLAPHAAIHQAIARYYHIDESVDGILHGILDTDGEVEVNTVTETESIDSAEDLQKEAEGKPIVRLTNWLLAQAVEARASDIHIEPQDRDVAVRFRVDGMLEEIRRLPRWTQGALVSRIKILSDLDIAEKRRPQDGRLIVQIGGRRMDMRVSTLPITGGEKVVIRVADQKRAPVALDTFGFQAEEKERFLRFLERPQGIVVVTGPTGSGKTTLLYAALHQLQHVSKNIVTVEDPVEFHLPGINQVQVDEKAKKTFPLALRAILRQDPDIIMVGEIRDKETAQIAFRASVTGHLVLTTMHTNDTASAVTRLIDLGLEPFMVASSLIGVISLRLVRIICPRCREEYEGGSAQQSRLGMIPQDRPLKLFRGKGCVHCRQSGFMGRTGIFEVCEVNEPLRSLIVGGSPDTVIRHAATEYGMRSLGQDGIQKVLDGVTTLEEVSRVIYLAERVAKICPNCSEVLATEYQYCPHCRTFVGDHCTSCRRKISLDWPYCPFCGEVTENGVEPAGEGFLRKVS